MQSVGKPLILGKYIYNSLACYSLSPEKEELIGLQWWRHLMTAQRSTLCPAAQGVFELRGLKAPEWKKKESSGKLLCDQVLRCVLHPSPVLLSSKHLSRSYLQILISTTRRSGYIGLDKSSSAIRVPQLGTAQSCKYTMPLLTEIITPSLN